MWSMKNIYSTLCLLLLTRVMFGQITVTQNANSQSLSQLLAGNGVTISNYTLSCAANGSGTFTNVNTNLGMPGGVVLASGRVSNVPQAANAFASSQFTATGDAQLSTLTTGTIYDPCVLEFDIVPQGPLLKFDYVFASEEYPEWVCSKFNDVFGFFITGPNPGGGNYTNNNIALITNTNLPVAINTVNPGVPGANANGGLCNGTNQTLGYNSIFTDNLAPVNASIVYDGMTHLLTATAAVTPCQTYHLKIAIADVADRIYDSGVFLSAYSFNANPVSISATSNLNYAGFTSAYEGCVGGTFTLTLSQPQTVDLYVPLAISGTAINGVDYDSIPTTVVIPAGQTSVTIPLNPIADGIVEGAESVSIATLNPCNGAVSSTANINIRDDIDATLTVGDSTLCIGQSTQLTANGGVTYSWTPTAGLSNAAIRNPVATPTVTTTYICSMTFGACTKTVAQTIYVSDPTNTISANPNGVVCNGVNVTLTSVPANGVSPYTYLWSNGNTSANITATTSGSYIVTATDAYGCSASATKSVTISNLAISGTVANVSCTGGVNGAVDITVTGASAPFTYNWGSGIASQDRNNLPAGTYTVTASNTAGCSVTASYTVTQPTTNLLTSATNTAVTCNGGNNGSINLTPTGGVTPYTFLWSNAATTEDINAITTGSYSVTVTDLNGCTAGRTINITQPTAITTTETHVNGNCFGSGIGSIDLSATGGTGAYTYAWSNGASTQDISALSAGNYGVTVADANGCTVSRSVSITQPSAVNVTAAATNPLCFGDMNGAVNTTVTGGTPPYTYTWSNGATTPNLPALGIGTFAVTVTDNNGCSGTASASLTQPGALTVATAKTDVSCNGGSGGSITTTVNGGSAPYIYNWGGGITTAGRTNLSAGNYPLTVTDNNGCSVSASATIAQPAAIAITQTHANVSCNGGSTASIDITTTGGSLPYAYNWGGGITTEDRTNLAAGTYTVTVTDSKACTANLSIAITQPSSIATTLTAVNPVCNGAATGTIANTTTGGTSPYIFSWSDGNTLQNRSGLAAGTYNLTLTDNNGCSATASKIITQPSAINTASAVTNATCAAGNNGTITLTVTGGAGSYTYNWGGGITTPNRTGLVAGTYTVTVTDAAACTVAQPVTITQIGTGISLSSTVTNVACAAGNNGTIDISVTGGTAPITYNWGGGITTQDRTALAAGSYSITVTDGLGCSAVATNNVTQPTSIAIVKSTANVLCNGGATGSITLSVTGGTGTYTYNWGAGITTQNRAGLTAGNYTVTVTDANLCTATTSAAIAQPAAAISATAINTAVSCFSGNNGQADITVSGGSAPYTYNWSNGSISQDLNNVSAGNYQLTITDANACSLTFAAAISQPSAALATNLTATNILCNGANTGTITTSTSGGTASYSYNWSDANTSANRIALPAGNYALTVTDSKGCTASATAGITQPALLAVTATPTNITCNGNSNGQIAATATGGLAPYVYNWGGGITTQNRTALAPGTYNLTVTDGNSCTATASAVITQPSALTISMNSGTSVCANATGTATAVTNNTGSAPYTYTWSNGGANTQTQNGLAPGLITVTVTDANSCSASASVSVGLSGNNTNAAFTYTGAPCGPNATINFNHTGSANVAHSWDFGTNNGTSTLSNPAYTFPAAGTFQVTHIVTRGYCLDSIKQNVIIYPKPMPNIAATNVSCNGMANGAINVTVSSGTPAFTYNWGSGITTQNRTGLAPGTYTLTVTDATPCSASAGATITQPAILTVTNSNTNVTCNGGNNGAVNLTATGGTPAYSYNWGGGVTTQNRTGLAGGTYTVTVSDANACSSVNNIVVYQPNAVTVTAAVTGVSCHGLNDGAINLSATGGSGTYTFNWGGGITGQNRTALSAGTYSVTATDANSCSGTLAITISQPATLSTSLASMNVSCNGGNNGSIATTTNGGTAPYSYIWNDNNFSENRQTLAAGNYTVTVNDLNNCSVTASIAVGQPSTAVNVTIGNTNNINCYGDSTGSISIAVSGGTPAYTYTWSDGASVQNRVNLQSGTYRISVTDGNGCQASASALINQPAQALTIDTVAATNVLCYGSNSGSINITINGGTNPYTFNWGGGIVSQNRNNLSAGTYNITVTDNKACSVSASAVITQPAAALGIATVATNLNCNNSGTGAIDVTVSGGVNPYNFNWGAGITTEDRTGLAAGTYTVTITDANNCSASKSTTLTQPPALTVSVSSTTNVSCFGGNNGALTVLATGGNLTYNYQWSGGQSVASITNLTAGSYTLTVTDGNNCSASSTGTVTQPAAALSVAVTATTNVLCFGNNTGSITTVATGGTTAYTYNWGNGITTQNRTGITAGTYQLTVTDAKACSATTSATITQPAAALGITTVATNLSCNNAGTGAIDVTVSGGVNPYNYNWGGGIITGDRTGLAAGTYTVTVTDANNCSVSKATTLTQPSALTAAISATTNVSCFGGNNGSLNVVANGGASTYIYQWSSGQNTASVTNLTAGNYSLTITDGNSCSTTASATITQPASALSVSLASATNVLCFGGNNGSITTAATGGTSNYSYHWGGGITTPNRTGLSAGAYQVTVTDANNCSASVSAIISQPASAINIMATSTNVNCFGAASGNINISVSGGTGAYNYNWGGAISSQNRTNVAAGTYTLTVTDANNCTATHTTTITQPTAINATLGSLSNVSCFGGNNGSANITATGGVSSYTYSWNNGISTSSASGLSAGTYTVTVTDANACTTTTTATVGQPAQALTTNVASFTNVSCLDGSNGAIVVTSTGGTSNYSYLWNDGATSQSRSGITAGTYSVTVTDAHACSATTAATITQPTQSMELAMNKTNLLCDGSNTGSINLTVTGGVQPLHFMWSNGQTAEDQQGLTAGVYTVSVTDNNGCTASNSISIASPYPIILTETHTNIMCHAQTNANIYAYANGGVPPYNFIWNNGATSRALTNVGGGDYSVVVTDSNGCSASLSSIVVTEPDNIGLGINVTNISCAGINSGAITTSATGGTAPYQYHWSNNNTGQNLTNAAVGSYLVTVTDANGCSQTANAFINAVPPMNLTAEVDVLACLNSEGGINLTVSSGTAPYTYTWNTGATTEDLATIHPGTYSVTVHDANNCLLDTSFTVVNLNSFDVTASGGGTVTLGETAELHVTSSGSDGVVYSWTPVFGTDCNTCTDVTVQPGQTTLYTVVGTDTNGCQAQDTVSVNVIDDHTIFPPNAFSPNGDGNNDVFQLFGNLAGIKKFNIMIFDRWGEKVFEANEATFSWDGTYKNEKLPPSVCVYVMKAVFLDGYNEKIYKGSITILR